MKKKTKRSEPVPQDVNAGDTLCIVWLPNHELHRTGMPFRYLQVQSLRGEQHKFVNLFTPQKRPYFGAKAESSCKQKDVQEPCSWFTDFGCCFLGSVKVTHVTRSPSYLDPVWIYLNLFDEAIQDLLVLSICQCKSVKSTFTKQSPCLVNAGDAAEGCLLQQFEADSIQDSWCSHP